MSRKRNGEFSTSFDLIQLQLRTLFEGVGGDRAIKLLDLISKLGRLEQEIVLKSFSTIVERLLGGEQRLSSREDRALTAFEDRLYSEVIGAMKLSASNDVDSAKLELVKGGRDLEAARTPLDLTKARNARKNGKGAPLLN